MKEALKTAKSHRRADVLLIAALLLASAIGLLYLYVFEDSGDMVRVTVDGVLYGVYSLSQPTVEEIHSGADGDQRNRLIIRDGKAYIEAASCPDGICVAHSPICRNGESIVCLPNRVVVTVVSRDASDGPDVVA
ncbi:MAG: NusG domain II-containing protein [Clostridia bacterium]|nr:NusG domain II-containing protein [Clostridia bacterium]